MTTVDPTHIPATFRAAKRELSKEQAIYHARHANSSERSRLQMPTIKDFRFEPYYLDTLAPYVRVVERDPHEQDEQYESGLDVGIEQSREIVVTNWSQVVWVTVRDQVLNPLLQGALWGAMSWSLAPALRYYWGRLRQPSVAHPARPVRKTDGQFIERLRTWSKGLAMGVETSTVGTTK